MKPSLQLRLSQHLALTPQLQQSIRLLQLSTLELHQEIEQMLEQNPFLEVADEAPLPESAQERVAAAERVAEREDAETRVDAGADAADETAGVDSVEFGATERDDWENGTEREDFDGITELPELRAAGAGNDDGDDFEGRERGSAAESLQDHLRAQVLGMRLAAEDAAALDVLIDSLDEDGYLADTLEEIAERLAGDDPQGAAELLERLQCGLKWLQSMEPCGVGAPPGHVDPTA